MVIHLTIIKKVHSKVDIGQGDPFNPLIFNAAFEISLDTIRSSILEIITESANFIIQVYADDLVVALNNKSGKGSFLKTMKKIQKSIGFEISFGKTRVLNIGNQNTN